jgi:chitin disaccharide deacetylase
MNPNPSLKKLGFSNTDRVVIIHTDDIGMCQASVSAFAELNAVGIISSGAVMVPCAWFAAAAAYCREHPQADMGVHLTITSEWDAFRWGPISTRDAVSGLMDGEGYFYRNYPEVIERGDADAVAIEFEMQVMRAKQAGIEPTHIDTHMGTALQPKFFSAYVQTAMHHKLPIMIPRDVEAATPDPERIEAGQKWVAMLDGEGVPMVDYVVGSDLRNHTDKLSEMKHKASALKPGITHFLMHPSHDTPELRAICPDWRARVADFETFMREEFREHLQEMGVQVIGYKALKNIWR